MLTTNGKDDPLTDDTALRLRQDGVRVLVVGLDKDLDPSVFRNISGDSNQVYIVPNTQGLSTVIRDVITNIEDNREGNRQLARYNVELSPFSTRRICSRESTISFVFEKSTVTNWN